MLGQIWGFCLQPLIEITGSTEVAGGATLLILANAFTPLIANIVKATERGSYNRSSQSA